MLSCLSRREVLLLGAVSLPLLLSACTNEDATPPADPDRVSLEEALGVETALLVTVANVRGSGTGAEQSVHAVQAHVMTLASALRQSPSATAGIATPSGASASPALPVSVDDAVRAADRAASAHTRALRSSSAEVTPLLASIAASDAAVASVLRGGGA